MPDSYCVDEPSIDAVRYLVWQTMNELQGDHIYYPNSSGLDPLAQAAFHFLDDEFEQAPINNERKATIDALVTNVNKGFIQFRESLLWFNDGCYLSNYDQRQYDKALKFWFELLRPADLSGISDEVLLMYLYGASVSLFFSFKSGSLALTAPQWLAALAHTLGHEKECELIRGIEVLDDAVYKYTIVSDDCLHLDNLKGRQFDIRPQELNRTIEDLKNENACLAQFVFFNGEWRLNGLCQFLDLSAQLEQNLKAQADNAGHKILSGDELLERTGGKRLIFFKNRSEMAREMKRMKLMPSNEDVKALYPHQLKFPCLFIDVDALKHNVYVVSDWTRCIASPDNPYYKSTKKTVEEVEDMLMEPSAYANFVDWLIDQDFFPDARKSKLFMPGITPRQLRGDMHFMIRASRRNDLDG